MTLEEASRLQNEERYEEANQIFVNNLNNMNARVSYARNLYYGNGVEKNRSEAYKLFDDVINATQNLKIIEMYANLRFLDADIFMPNVSELKRYEAMTRTFDLLEFAITFGSTHPHIYCNYGLCYETGYGTVPNYEKAIMYYTQSIQLAVRGFENTRNKLFFRIGRLQLFNENTLLEGFKNIKIAAENNYLPSFVYIGRICYEGKIVDKDESTAFFYFTKAAKKGVIEGQFYLAEMYEKGIEKVVEKNLNKAIELYFAVATSLSGKNEVIIESLPKTASLPENCEPIDQRAIEKLRTYRPELLNLLEKYKNCSSQFENCTKEFTHDNGVYQRTFNCFDQPNMIVNYDCICANCMKKCYDKSRLIDHGILKMYCDCLCSKI